MTCPWDYSKFQIDSAEDGKRDEKKETKNSDEIESSKAYLSWPRAVCGW